MWEDLATLSPQTAIQTTRSRNKALRKPTLSIVDMRARRAAQEAMRVRASIPATIIPTNKVASCVHCTWTSRRIDAWTCSRAKISLYRWCQSHQSSILHSSGFSAAYVFSATRSRWKISERNIWREQFKVRSLLGNYFIIISTIQIPFYFFYTLKILSPHLLISFTHSFKYKNQKGIII